MFYGHRINTFILNFEISIQYNIEPLHCLRSLAIQPLFLSSLITGIIWSTSYATCSFVLGLAQNAYLKIFMTTVICFNMSSPSVELQGCKILYQENKYNQKINHFWCFLLTPILFIAPFAKNCLVFNRTMLMLFNKYIFKFWTWFVSCKNTVRFQLNK